METRKEVIAVSRSRSKNKGKSTKPPKSSKPPVKPAAPRKSPRQAQLAHTEDPNADAELDELVRETYDLTATWLAAGEPMRASRTKLAEAMRSRGLDIYRTHDGYLVKRATAKEKLSVTKADDGSDVEIDEAAE